MKMKKTKILGLVLALIMFFTNLPFGMGIVHAEAVIKIDEINFPDKKFKDYVSKKYDKDKNGELSQEERDAVKEIKVNRAQFDDPTDPIKDLKGIECFPNLETLNCYNNSLEKLDLTQNKMLKTLNCGENKLTSLDLTENKDLSTLKCNANNIQDLNLNNNKELTSLNCAFTGLTSLTLSKNTKLSTLDCSANKITKLELKNNKDLTTLICKNTQISELDLSGLEKLKNIEFYMTPIIKLDLSNCKKLEKLECSITKIDSLTLDDCNNLTDLDCSFTPLKALDVSTCSSLKKLNCINSQISSLVLGGNKTLTTVYCSNNKLTELDISDCTALEELECNDNDITQIKTKDNNALTKLKCGFNKIDELDLSSCPALKELDCSKNDMTSLKIEKNPELSELVCASNKLKEINLSGNGKLKKLDCSYNKLTNLNLDSNTKLEEIRCNDNKLNSLDLSANAALKSLYCSNNHITKLDLNNNLELQDLSLENNELTLLDLSNNNKINSYYYNGEKQTSSLTLEADTKTIKANQLGDKFDLSKVELTEGGSIDEANNSIKLNEGATFIKYKYKARNKCKLHVTVNLNFKDKIVVKPNPADPGEVPNGRVRITFDAGYYSTVDEKNKCIYIDVLKNTEWKNKELIDAFPKTAKTTLRGQVFDKWEPKIPNEGNVYETKFTAKFKDKEFDPNKFNDIEIRLRPDKMTYIEGENLELSGLCINLIDEGGAEIYLCYEDFKNNEIIQSKGITLNPDNGTTLALADNNKKLTIKIGDITKEIGKLTVNPKPIIGPVNPSKVANPDEDIYWTVKFISADETKGTVAEENTFYVSKVAKMTLEDIAEKVPTVTPIGNNKFNGWDRVLNNYAEINQNLEIMAQFSELDAIIGPKDPTKEDGKNPDKNKYYTVTFVSEDEQHGSVAAENTFYVLKNASKTLAAIADRVPKTTAKEKYAFDGWDQLINETTIIDRDLTIKAQFKKLNEVVGPVDPNAQNVEELKDPSKYYKVEFMSPDASGTQYALSNFYVLKTSGLKLSNILSRISKPDPIGDKIFVKWEAKIGENDTINNDLIIKAIFRDKGETPDPKDPEKPVGPNTPGTIEPSPNECWTVTFVSENESKGTVEGANTFYIPKTDSKKLSDLNIDSLKIIPKTGYKFEKWDTDLNTNIGDNLTVIAIFIKDETNPGTKPNPPVGPNKPEDPQDPSNPSNPQEPGLNERNYFIIRFLSDDPDRGYIGRGDTITIDKSDRYTIADLARLAPVAIPYRGYEFAGWLPYLYGNDDLIKGDMNIYARFVEAYVPRYFYERPEPRRTYDDRDHREEKKEPVVEEHNNYDKLEAILFINDYVMQKSVNGVVSQVRMDIAPFIYQSRTMLPLRYVAESLGFMVTWDANTRTVYLVDKENIVQIPVNTNNIIVNGKTFTSDVKPMIKNNRTMLPVANVARALGLEDGKDILWDAAMKYVTLRRNVLK